MPYNETQGYQNRAAEDEAMGWDGMLNGDDARGFEILPEGDYHFTVKQFTRGRYEGGEKMPPCNKAALILSLKSAWTPTAEKPPAEGEVSVNLFIVKSQRWKLSQFFTSIGFLRPGEEKPMNWGIVPGSSGMCAVTQRKWTNRDGKEYTSNDVTRFYSPEDRPSPTPTASQFGNYPPQNAAPQAAAPQGGGWKPGSF